MEFWGILASIVRVYVTLRGASSCVFFEDRHFFSRVEGNMTGSKRKCDDMCVFSDSEIDWHTRAISGNMRTGEIMGESSMKRAYAERL